MKAFVKTTTTFIKELLTKTANKYGHSIKDSELSLKGGASDEEHEKHVQDRNGKFKGF